MKTTKANIKIMAKKKNKSPVAEKEREWIVVEIGLQ